MPLAAQTARGCGVLTHPAELKGPVRCQLPTAWSKGRTVLLTLSLQPLTWQGRPGPKLNKLLIPSDPGQNEGEVPNS